MIEEPDFTGLRATYINCTLNRSPARSHTQGVIDRSVAITEAMLHLASMIRRAGGFPAYGNQRTAWDLGSHPDHADPEYR